MNDDQINSDQTIFITLPIKINFKAIEDAIHDELIGKIISKTKSNGRELKYFKILDLKLAKSTTAPYNLDFDIKLQALTLLFNGTDLNLALHTKVELDVNTQRLYVDAYQIEKVSDSWISNSILKSVINPFIYQKVINALSVDLTPIIAEKLNTINTNLASKLNIDDGISLIGHIESLALTHLEVKENELWVLINGSGWLILDIAHLQN